MKLSLLRYSVIQLFILAPLASLAACTSSTGENPTPNESDLTAPRVCGGVSVSAHAPCATTTICTSDWNPVCGADGKTYSNACHAEAAGQAVRSAGECPPQERSCGGKMATPCADNELCDYRPDAICGWTDATGTCKPKPEVCPTDFNRVCGCDGKTYSNRCTANAAGIGVLTDAPCR